MESQKPERRPTAQPISHRNAEPVVWCSQERAQEARKQQRMAEDVGASYTPSNADMFAGLMDYAKDKWQHPPLLQVERNLLLHQEAIRLSDEVLLLRKLIDPLIHTAEFTSPDKLLVT